MALVNTETFSTYMNKHLTAIIKDHNKQVEKWVFVYRMLSMQQQKEFEEWKTEQAHRAMRQFISCLPTIPVVQCYATTSESGAVTISTDMNEQLIRFTKEHDRKVAEWIFVHGMLSEQQRKEFQEWKTEQLNLEMNEYMSDDSSDEDENEEEEATDDDDDTFFDTRSST